MITKAISFIRKIPTFRSPMSDMMALSEEVGELATEISIMEGYKNRPSGPDGITGEVADVIVVAIDILQLAHPTKTAEELEEILVAEIRRKYTKWGNYFGVVE